MSARRDGPPGFRPSPAEVRLLAEIGFTATIRVPGFDGGPIFAALDALHPDHSAAAIGRALQALARRAPEQAVEVLERDGVAKPRGGDDAKALLVLALTLAGDRERALGLKAELAGAAGAADRLATAALDRLARRPTSLEKRS